MGLLLLVAIRWKASWGTSTLASLLKQESCSWGQQPMFLGSSGDTWAKTSPLCQSSFSVWRTMLFSLTLTLTKHRNTNAYNINTLSHCLHVLHSYAQSVYKNDTEINIIVNIDLVCSPQVALRRLLTPCCSTQAHSVDIINFSMWNDNMEIKFLLFAICTIYTYTTCLMLV